MVKTNTVYSKYIHLSKVASIWQIESNEKAKLVILERNIVNIKQNVSDIIVLYICSEGRELYQSLVPLMG